MCTSISLQILIMQQSTRDGIETTPLSTTGLLTCTDDDTSVHAAVDCGDTWNCKEDDSSACAAARKEDDFSACAAAGCSATKKVFFW